MKHPIYNNQQEIDMMHIVKRGMTLEEDKAFMQVFLNGGQTQRHYRAFINRIIIKTQIEYNGCNLIQLKQANEWDEVLSVKTIEKMNTNDLKLPFNAYTIDITSSEWTVYDYVHIIQSDKSKTFVFEQNKDVGGGKQTHVMILDHGENIKEEVDKIVQDEVIPQILKLGVMDIALDSPLTAMRNAIYKVISISMYMTMFKRDKQRCVEVKTVNKKSKRKRIPGHETNVVYLSQPKYTLDGATGGGGKTTGLFVVKGHWRSQPYGKREEGKIKQIFIDSFFKGQGAKIMQKTYKV